MSAVPGRTRFPDGLTVGAVRNGRGIVARKPFPRGETICEISGRIVTGETVWRWWDRDTRRAENCFRYDADHYLDPREGIGAFANHSCRPNAGVVKRGPRLMLKAIEPIRAGDEVTHDYSTLLGADDVWEMPCNCGESACRKMVGSFRTLPAAVLRRYKALGIVPRYILATIAEE